VHYTPRSRHSMRARTSSSARIAIVLLCETTALAQTPTPRPVPTQAWAPKPVAIPGYTPPQQPWVKLSDLRTRHQGQRDWRELLVDDGRLTGEYVSAAPGTKTTRRFHPDTREWFAVVEGEVKVDIEGQESFVAKRGSLVNLPRQTVYSLETIGDRPSLRFVVNVAKTKTLYPVEVEPPQRRLGCDGSKSR
jgi:quercetin dioxygenase-like cupin family protein